MQLFFLYGITLKPVFLSSYLKHRTRFKKQWKQLTNLILHNDEMINPPLIRRLHQASQTYDPPRDINSTEIWLDVCMARSAVGTGVEISNFQVDPEHSSSGTLPTAFKTSNQEVFFKGQMKGWCQAQSASGETGEGVFLWSLRRITPVSHAKRKLTFSRSVTSRSILQRNMQRSMQSTRGMSGHNELYS